MPFCNKCGTEVPENVSFCQECGNSLQSGQTNQANKAAPVANADIENLSLWGYFIKCLKNYVNFKDRARRKEYWGFLLFQILIEIGLIVLMTVFFGDAEETFEDALLTLYFLGMLLPCSALYVRRLHDIGESSWYALPIIALDILIFMIPELPDDIDDWPARSVGIIIASIICTLLLGCIKGEAKKNEYGSSPK